MYRVLVGKIAEHFANRGRRWNDAPAWSASAASTSGPKRSTSRAVDGRHIRIGTRSKEL
jgi:hypothetical protein